MKWIACVIVLLVSSVALGQNFQIRPFPGEIARPIDQPSLPLPICHPQYEWRWAVTTRWVINECGQLQQQVVLVRVLVRVR